VVPLVDTEAVTVLAARSILTHQGAVPAPPDVWVESPPSMMRRWKANPLAAETIIIPCRDCDVSEARTITLVKSAE
jgi:hypothetical protein